MQAVTYRHARLVISDNEKINRMYWSDTPSAGGRGFQMIMNPKNTRMDTGYSFRTTFPGSSQSGKRAKIVYQRTLGSVGWSQK